MDIYSSIGPMAHIVTVPREFHVISTDPEMFTIHSGDVNEALQDAEMNYYGPLMLHTPFHSEEAFCYIAARSRSGEFISPEVVNTPAACTSPFMRPAAGGGGVSVCH